MKTVAISDLLEHELAQRFHRKYCILVGSGTTALYCVFEMFRELHADVEEPAILFPNITCETAINAAIFAGFLPRFCDVRKADYVMCTESARREVSGGDITAIVPTHIFGHLVDIPALKQQVGDKVAVVEDAAQGYGGRIAQFPAGSMGDASIVSFGDGKLLDCGGGGALLCDDSDFAFRCREIASKLTNDDSGRALVRGQMMKEMLAARKHFRGDRAGLVRRQRGILREHREGYLGSCRREWTDSIVSQLSKIEEVTRDRQELTERLDDALSGAESVSLPVRAGTPALWRYTFLIDATQRDKKIRALKDLNIEASRLFNPCSEKFSEIIPPLPSSEEVAKEIVNLHIPHSNSEHEAFVQAVKKVFS